MSAYRSYALQKRIFDSKAAERGEEEANQASAKPGQSEHQTGLAIDVSCRSVDFELEESFGETKCGQWLAKHAADFGFIIRYPKGKSDITGYEYEPWHIRYVGKQAAQAITGQGLVLEQYLTQPGLKAATQED